MTLTELLAVMLTLGIVLAMLLPGLARTRTRPARIKCVNNLKNIGLAFRIFATDNGDLYPMAILSPTNGTAADLEHPLRIWRHFAVMSNELSTPKILICPEDRLRRVEATTFSLIASNKLFAPFAANQNISYFVGLDASETRPLTLLSGDRSITNDIPVRFTYGRAVIGKLGTNHTRARGAGWDPAVHRHGGNAALGDGSVQQLTTDRLRQHLRESDNPDSRIASPD